jgi:hypothetical protein
MGDIDITRLQSENVLIRPIELSELGIDAGLLKHASRFRQKEVGDAACRKMANLNRSLSVCRLGSVSCRQH